jgi:hypothetical protein
LNGIRIPPEWLQESCRWNGARNEWNGILNAQIERRHLPMLDLGIINEQTMSSSTTTTTIDDRTDRHLLATIVSPPLPHCHHHQRLAVSAHIRRPQPAHQHTMTLHHEHHVTYRTSAGHIDTTQQQRGVMGATLLAAMWMNTTNNDNCHRSSLLFIVVHHSESPHPSSSPPTLLMIPSPPPHHRHA